MKPGWGQFFVTRGQFRMAFDKEREAPRALVISLSINPGNGWLKLGLSAGWKVAW
jgi:hypothetical protein